MVMLALKTLKVVHNLQHFNDARCHLLKQLIKISSGPSQLVPMNMYTQVKVLWVEYEERTLRVVCGNTVMPARPWTGLSPSSKVCTCVFCLSLA